MPTIAIPRRVESEPRRPRPRRDDAPSAGIKLRLTVTARRATLTRQLAAGVDPASTPELALRASQLTSRRGRRQMARTLRRTVTEARRPALTRAPLSIVNRYAVLEAADAVQATIARLASPDPVCAMGMARLERLVTDGVSSPLYDHARRDALGHQLLLARAKLDPSSRRLARPA